MSTGLGIRLTRAIKIAELMQATADALRDILAVDEVPGIRILEYKSCTLLPLTFESIGKDEASMMVKLSPMEDAAWIIVLETLLYPETSLTETGWWVEVDRGATGSPLEFVLVASVAVAFARLCDTTIVDDALRWNKTTEQTANDFVAAIKVHRQFTDLQDAAKHLYMNSPAKHTVP